MKRGVKEKKETEGQDRRTSIVAKTRLKKMIIVSPIEPARLVYW